MTADTYSTDGVGCILMGTGNDNNTWGANANTAAFQVIIDSITNVLTSAVTGGTLDLSGTPPPAAASSARYAALKFTGVLGSNQLVQVPNLNKWWLVCNATSGAFTLKFKTSGGSASTAIPQNSGWQMVRCDGSNVIEVWPFNTATVQMPDGTVSAPAYSNITEPTSGWYRAGTQDWRLSINGVAVLQCTGTGAGSPSLINVLSPNALQVNGVGVIANGAVIKASDGTVGAPGISFNSELTSGLYRIGAGDVGFSILGVKVSEWTATAYTVVTKLTLTSTDSMAMAKGTTAQRNGSPTEGDTRYNSSLHALEYWDGTLWRQASALQQPVAGSFKNLLITNNAGTPNTKIDLTADAVVADDTSNVSYKAASVSLTIDCGTNGANGLDTGGLANSTWYSVWTIYNPTTATVAGLASTSTTAPTMPSGYTAKCRLGWFRTDTSAHFLRLIQYARRAQYIVGVNPTNMPKMANANTGGALTAVAVGAFVPPTTSVIWMTLNKSNGGTIASVAPNASYGSDGSTTNPPVIALNTAAGAEEKQVSILLETTNIYWASNSTSNSLWVNGWEDNI